AAVPRSARLVQPLLEGPGERSLGRRDWNRPMMLRIVAALGATSALGASLLVPPTGEAPRVVAERGMGGRSMGGGEGPMWSPDGSRIFFASPLAAGGLASVPVEGGAPVRVTGPIAAQIARLAPRGDQLAFVSDKAGNPEIWLASIGDGTERQLTNL